MSDPVRGGRGDLSGAPRLVADVPRARPSPRRYRAAAAVSAAVLSLVAGCGSGPPSASAASPAASSAAATNDAAPPVPASSAPAAAHTLEISDFLFVPQTLTVPAGAVVTVANQDGANHTVTATDGSFDTGNIAGHATGTFTAPTTPGSYPYKCAIHPFMTGKVTVTG